MEFRLLGPVEAHHDGQRVDLGPRKPRFVFAVLALSVNRPVPVDRLVELTWPESPPRTAAHAVRVFASQLRTALAGRPGVTLARQGSGYALLTDPLRIDAHLFRDLVEQARTAPGDEERVDLLERALRLWSGPALDGTAPEAIRDRLCRGLDDARLGATEDRLDAKLRLGCHREVLDELATLVDAHPLRERLVGQLMLALYRSGRAGDALAVHRAARNRLATELGLDPGPELRSLEQAVLRDDPAIAVPAPAVVPHQPVPAELPPVVAGFVGRDAEIARLDRLLNAGTAVTIVAGTAGVGKTALALHWAHRVADRFPDGQLFVDLRGYVRDRPPLDALAHCLRALGVPAERVPVEPASAAALYRTVLAGRRVLVVLDNAADPDQVRPLLPGGPGCAVLVTSRERLGGLVARDGARRLPLDVLGGDEARALLSSVLGAGRVAAEPGAVEDLARLCAYLPLALRIAAAHLTDHPDRRVGDYVAGLAGGDRLATLAMDGEEDAAVRAAFEVSQVALAAPVRRLFRLLGRTPGPDIDAAGAAALAGLPAAEVTPLLARLTAAHLVEERVPGRYRLHELLRLYARDLAVAEDSEAVSRLLAFYLDGVDAAATRLYPHTQRLPRPAGGGPAVTFEDAASALAWLDAERANLVGAVRHAAAGADPVAWLLSDGLRGYFWLGRHAMDGLAVGEAALSAAVAAGDIRGQSSAHLSLGQVMRWLARHDEAAAQYNRARLLSRRAGWEPGEAAATGSLANVYRDQGRLAAAAEHYTQVADVYARTGAHAAVALTECNLGHVYLELGRLTDAVDRYRRGLDLSERIGARLTVALARDGLGIAAHLLGNLDEALGHVTAALAIHRESGSREGEADALTVLGEVHRAAGRYPQALTDASAALAVAREAKVSRVEVDALVCLGWLHRSGADTAGHLAPTRPEPVDCFAAARALAAETGYRFGEATALLGVAAVAADAGRLDDAAATCERVLASARDLGFAVVEGRALTRLALVHLAAGRADEAGRHADLALAVQRRTGHRLGAAASLLVRAEARRDDADRAAALARYAEVGAPAPDGPPDA